MWQNNRYNHKVHVGLFLHGQLLAVGSEYRHTREIKTDIQIRDMKSVELCPIDSENYLEYAKWRRKADHAETFQNQGAML